MTSLQSATFRTPTAPDLFGPAHRRLWWVLWRRCRPYSAGPDADPDQPTSPPPPNSCWPDPADRDAGRGEPTWAMPANVWWPDLPGRDAGQRDRSARPVPPPVYGSRANTRLRATVHPHPSPAASARESASRGVSRRGISFGLAGPRFAATAGHMRPAETTPIGRSPARNSATRLPSPSSLPTAPPLPTPASLPKPTPHPRPSLLPTPASFLTPAPHPKPAPHPSAAPFPAAAPHPGSSSPPAPSTGAPAEMGRAGWLTPAQEHRANGGRP